MIDRSKGLRGFVRRCARIHSVEKAPLTKDVRQERGREGQGSDVAAPHARAGPAECWSTCTATVAEVGINYLSFLVGTVAASSRLLKFVNTTELVRRRKQTGD